ncbi:YbaK/EbsC family protein [Proteiniborus sp.]|uniref:YbaK/EbsC family protein n=1 Tax=Proteiniborus sp. TaxID=2079015 RepID=UPI00332B6D9C
MTVESVKNHIEKAGLDLEITEMDKSTATVELAANTLGVEPARIAKTMAISLKYKDILIVAKGDMKIDNRKFKDYFKEKVKFVKQEEVEKVTGHPMGGVCPFGLIKPLDIYLDISLKDFDYVYPAAGSPNTCLKIDVDYLSEVTKGIWIDVCKI